MESPLTKVNGPWKDITGIFKLAISKSLTKQGDMHMAKDFTLHNSLSALELMSAKMDPAYQNTETDQTKLSIARRLEKLSNLNWKKLEVITDQLFFNFANFLSGHSLLTTVFSSVFLEKTFIQTENSTVNPNEPTFPKGIFDLFSDEEKVQIDGKEEDNYLRTTAELFVALSSLCHHLILTADMFSEEDYMAYLGDFQFPSISRQFFAKSTTLIESEKVPQYEKVSLKILLNLIKAISLCSTATISKDQTEKFCKAESCFLEAQNLLPELKKETTDDELLQLAFDRNINGHFLGPTPPRSLYKFEDKALADVLGGFIKDCLFSVEFRNCNNLVDAFHFLQAFSSTNPNILSRSIICPLLYSRRSKSNKPIDPENQEVTDDIQDIIFGKLDFVEALLADLKRHGIPNYVTQEWAEVWAKGIGVRATYEVMRILIGNRSRVRRQAKNWLETVKEKSQVAQYLDHKAWTIKAGKEKAKTGIAEDGTVYLDYLNSYLLMHVYEILLVHVQLGFPLNIYTLNPTNRISEEGRCYVEESFFMLWTMEFLFKGLNDMRGKIAQYGLSSFDTQLQKLSKDLQEEQQKGKDKNKIKKLKRKMLKIQSAKQMTAKKSVGETIVKSVQKSAYRSEVQRYLVSGILCIFLIKFSKSELLLGDDKKGTKFFDTLEQKYDTRLESLRELNLTRPNMRTFREIVEALSSDQNGNLDAKVLLASARDKFQQTNQYCRTRIKELKGERICILGEVEQAWFKKIMKLSLQNLVVVNQIMEQSEEKWEDIVVSKVQFGDTETIEFPLVKLNE
eukprot:snap_masked-scaffold_92-processed-gene-0.21-mRNA-1 protein AED:1.00 eAED:1.00 QI:0/-1/0/0/-1/1/1/0/792